MLSGRVSARPVNSKNDNRKLGQKSSQLKQ